MGNPSAKVSVIITTYNRPHYVVEAVKSVLTQTYSNLEIIVVDDGSTEETAKALEVFGSKIRYFYQANQGVSAARNFGIEQTTGEYVAFLDDDDLWLAQKLERQMTVLEDNPTLGFVCSEAYTIDTNGNRNGYWYKGKSKKETFDALLEENFVLLLTVVARRNLLLSVNGFDKQLSTSADYDLWLRLAQRTSFLYIAEPLAKYRLHSVCMSSNFSTRFKDHLVILNKKEVTGHLSWLNKRKRFAKAYYQFAQYFEKKNQHKQAGKAYLNAIIRWPFIGQEYWPAETKNMRFSIFYRILKVYWLVIENYMKSLRINRSTLQPIPNA